MPASSAWISMSIYHFGRRVKPDRRVVGREDEIVGAADYPGQGQWALEQTAVWSQQPRGEGLATLGDGDDLPRRGGAGAGHAEHAPRREQRPGGAGGRGDHRDVAAAPVVADERDPGRVPAEGGETRHALELVHARRCEIADGDVASVGRCAAADPGNSAAVRREVGIDAAEGQGADAAGGEVTDDRA